MISVAVGLVAGCGRDLYDTSDAARPHPDAGGARMCAWTTPFGPHEMLFEAMGPEFVSTPSLSADGLVLRFLVDQEPFVQSRPSLDAPFGGASRETPSTFADVGLVRAYFLRDDGLERFVSLDVPGMQADLFIQRRSRASDPWAPPVPLASINSAENDWDPLLGDDGLTLWLQRQSSTEVTVFRTRWSGLGAPFDGIEPVDLSAAGSSPGTPSLVADGSVVVFSSDDRIWRAPIDASGSVGAPVEVIGAEPGVLQFEPFIRPDGCEIFWVRDSPHTLVHARRAP